MKHLSTKAIGVEGLPDTAAEIFAGDFPVVRDDLEHSL